MPVDSATSDDSMTSAALHYRDDYKVRAKCAVRRLEQLAEDGCGKSVSHGWR